MQIRKLVRKYNSFTGSDWDGMETFIDSLSRKSARKMFLSMYKTSDREGQRIWKATKRLMQD